MARGQSHLIIEIYHFPVRAKASPTSPLREKNRSKKRSLRPDRLLLWTKKKCLQVQNGRSTLGARLPSSGLERLERAYRGAKRAVAGAREPPPPRGKNKDLHRDYFARRAGWRSLCPHRKMIDFIGGTRTVGCLKSLRTRHKSAPWNPSEAERRLYPHFEQTILSSKKNKNLCYEVVQRVRQCRP